MTKTLEDLEELEDKAIEYRGKLCRFIAEQVALLIEDHKKGNTLTESMATLGDLNRRLGAILHAQGKIQIKGWDTDERTEESSAGQPTE